LVAEVLGKSVAIGAGPSLAPASPYLSSPSLAMPPSEQAAGRAARLGRMTTAGPLLASWRCGGAGCGGLAGTAELEPRGALAGAAAAAIGGGRARAQADTCGGGAFLLLLRPPLPPSSTAAPTPT
jgi:hypothetical protein